MGAYNNKVLAGHKIKQVLGQTATTTAQLFRDLRGDGISNEITSVLVTNLNDTANLLVSTDGGTNSMTVYPLGSIDMNTESVHGITITSSSGSVSFDLFYTVRQ